jgi:hypothetical protein
VVSIDKLPLIHPYILYVAHEGHWCHDFSEYVCCKLGKLLDRWLHGISAITVSGTLFLTRVNTIILTNTETVLF